MAAQFLAPRQTFTVPVTSGQYAPEVITFARASTSVAAGSVALLGVTIGLEGGGPASAVVELWMLRPGTDPSSQNNYDYSGTNLTSGMATVPLASWPGVQIRVKSGGTAGTAIVSASAD